MLENERLKRLTSLYSSYFGKFPKLEPGGLEVWSRFLDHVPIEKLEALVERVAEESEQRMPRLKVFKAVYARMGVDRDAKGNAKACGKCSESGWLSFPGKRIDGGRVVFDLSSRYMWSIPCNCTRGKEMPGGFDRKLQQDAIEHAVKRLGELASYREALCDGRKTVAEGAKQVLRDMGFLPKKKARWTP